MFQPAKVLLLYAHPESQDSVANRVLLKPATQLSNVTVQISTRTILISLLIFRTSRNCCVSMT